MRCPVTIRTIRGTSPVMVWRCDAVWALWALWALWAVAALPLPQTPENLSSFQRCPWEAAEALLLAFDPPWPTGETMDVTLPNDVKPGGDLTLTLRGEEDPYKFKVPNRGYGGRVVQCTMPQPPEDDYVAMARAGPRCLLTDPPVMRCKISDMWLEGKGGPVHNHIHTAELEEAIGVLDRFQRAQALVDKANWELELVKDRKKNPESVSKDLAKEAQQANSFWSTDRRGAPGKCYPRLEFWVNATKQLEERTKKHFKKLQDEASSTHERLKKKRDKVAGVEELTVNDRDVWGRTPLHWAAAGGQELMHVANFGNQGDPRKSPEIQAVDPREWAWLIRGLLARGAEPNMCDVDGRTPLDLAVTAGNRFAVDALLSGGAGLDTSNRWGRDILNVSHQVNASQDILSLITGEVSPVSSILEVTGDRVGLGDRAEATST